MLPEERGGHDVIVCVHDALEDVRKCLSSLARTWGSEGLAELIIVDDSSGDETAAFLRSFAAEHPYTRLLRCDERRYYTKAANAGLAASGGAFRTLLNSDTIVTEGWAVAIRRIFERWPGVGVVGPLSNAASSQSVPSIAGTPTQTAVNALPAGVTPDAIAAFLRERGRTVPVPFVPLIHGFCYTVRAEVVAAIGVFDDVAFPRGYGEECDYSFRVEDAGFALAVALDSYVYHAKSRSYGDEERVAYMQEGMRKLVERYSRRRVQRSVESMDNHPYLRVMRRAVEEAFFREGASSVGARRTSRLLAVTPLGPDGNPEGTGYIRVLGPLQHASLAGIVEMSLARCHWREMGDQYDAILVQRDAVRSVEDAAALIDHCEKKKLRLVYEIDDDLLNLPAGHPAAARFPVAVKEAMCTIAGRAHAVVVSNAALEERLSTYNRNVFVLPNALDEGAWRADGPSSEEARAPGSVSILYMGTHTHDDDFALLADAMRELLARYGDRITVTCVGGFAKKAPDWVRVRQVPASARSYPSFASWMARTCRDDIGVAPLVDNEFNRHKSYIKYLDYGICGLAPVMSNVQPYRDVIRHDETAVLVENRTEDWLRVLSHLIEDPARREELRRNARQDVLAHHTLGAQAEQRRRIWTDILSSTFV